MDKREIKFRFWDKKGHVLSSGLPLDRIKQIGDNDLPMQYTGLLDKNDKEIYEGDICNYEADCDPDNNNGTCQIEWWETKRDGVGWFTVFQGRHGVPFNQKDFTYTIIGNIYDNPELLKPIN